MTVEVWFRNPHNYIRELVECRVGRIAWDRGLLAKRRIDPHRHAELYYQAAGITDWKLLLVGDQGTAELDPTHGFKNPAAVYPTWTGSESLDLLEEMMAHPLGEDEEACSDMRVPPDERPVCGQPHVVVVIELPGQHTGPGRSLMHKLKELQEEYPDCVLHVHGSYSYRVAFGMGFKSVDLDPRTSASKGKIYMPNGKEIIAEKAIATPQWVNVLGMHVVDLKEARNRCIYNIKSALWAAENYAENVKFKSTPGSTASTTTAKAQPVQIANYLSSPAPTMPGDKVRCNTCSLQTKCKYFRAGAVCSVPGSEPAELARYFNTRDSSMIIDGLGTLLAAQTRRLERGMAEEETFGDLSPEVTKIMNQLFTNGVKLAKLVDPALSKPNVQVSVVAGSAQVGSATPNQLMGSIVRELEARGVPRDKITPEMIQSLLSEMAGGTPQQQAIEGTVLGSE